MYYKVVGIASCFGEYTLNNDKKITSIPTTNVMLEMYCSKYRLLDWFINKLDPFEEDNISLKVDFNSLFFVFSELIF